MHGVRVVDGRLYVVVSEVIERLDAVNDSPEDLVEDVVDARAANTLLGNLVDEATVNFLIVRLDE